MTQLDSWTGCYDQNWKNLITPAAFSHPAKFSHGLIKRIYDHALADGLIQPGGVVLDPFGGVGLGALYALQNGLHWVGVELEPKFVELARENIALWNARYAAHFPNWGTAQIIQGDSRRLCEVVGAAGLVVSSPPYAETFTGQKDNNENRASKISGNVSGRNSQIHHPRDYGSTPGQLATLPPGTPPQSKIQNPKSKMIVSSPPFAGNTGGRGEASRNGIDAALFDRHSGGMKKGTGDDPANLDHLPQGTPPVAIVSSPPYAESLPNRSVSNTEGDKRHVAARGRNPEGGGLPMGEYGRAPGQLGAMVVSSPPFADSVGSDDPDKRGGLFRDAKRRNDTNLTGTYGETEGQLGGMKAGIVVSSPPYEGTNVGNGDGENELKRLQKKAAAGELKGEHLRLAKQGRLSPHENANLADYGSTDGQIGATQGQTFWEAARLIVEQCALLLPEGGAAIWVVKGYIKNGKYVDFPGQWQALCEACGFETVHVHRAMLVKENGEQATMAAGHDTTGTTTNLLGEEVTTAGKALVNKKNRTQRKSFFRLLAEKKGAPPIDYESVLCMVKR